MQNHLPVDAGFANIESLDSDQHHAHEEYVITFMVAGCVVYQGEKQVVVKPGMLTLVPSGMPHALMKGSDMQVYWVSFMATLIGLDKGHPLLAVFDHIRCGALPMVKVASDRQEFVIKLFNEISRELQEGKSLKVLESLVVLVINEAIRASALRESDFGSETRLSQALKFIESQSCSGISLRDVAEHVHLSATYLAAKMKQTTGYTVGEWITKHRLKRAQALLLSTDKNIEHIAFELGWNDVTHFIRQFKKAHQKTPAAWRKEKR